MPNSAMNPEEPIIPYSEIPNISPNPKNQKPMAEKTKSARFFIATLMLFFDRVRPDSRHMNPGCIKNTRTDDTITQKLSRTELLMITYSPFNRVKIASEVSDTALAKLFFHKGNIKQNISHIFTKQNIFIFQSYFATKSFLSSSNHSIIILDMHQIDLEYMLYKT